MGIVKPGETSDVKVLLQPGETDEKHKFQVQSLVGESIEIVALLYTLRGF